MPRLGRLLLLALVVACAPVVARAQGGPLVPAFPPRVQRTVGQPPELRPPVMDSLARADVQFCLSPQGFRLRTFRSGTVRGEHARADARGLWVSRPVASGDPERFVGWSDIRRVELLETRERTAGEAWSRGATIGFAAGIVVALLVIPEPGDFGFLVYPLVITVAALPAGILGGVIGLQFRGHITAWDHCWP